MINKTSNKTWQWKKKNDQWKKELVAQTKGDSWAIRKSLHKETVSGNWKESKKCLGREIKATATRIELSDKFTCKQLCKVTDTGIQKILKKHLSNYKGEDGKEQFDLAFGVEGMNKNITKLNKGKPHAPIKKVRIYEEGNKFPISEEESSPKSKKYVEGAKGTNLFFAIYWNKEKKRREYETIPLHKVIEHQKQVAHLPKAERTPIPTDHEKGGFFLFSLSPNDLVYVPTDEEMDDPDLVNFNNLSKMQAERIYKMVSSSGNQCFFIQEYVAKPIVNKEEFSAVNKMEKTIEDVMVKDRCWKIDVDRLGNIQNKIIIKD